MSPSEKKTKTKHEAFSIAQERKDWTEMCSACQQGREVHAAEMR